MNLQGRVEKISLPPNPPRNCLQLLFDAVVNAIDAANALAGECGRLIELRGTPYRTRQLRKPPRSKGDQPT